VVQDDDAIGADRNAKLEGEKGVCDCHPEVEEKIMWLSSGGRKREYMTIIKR
jgi:hypothetical protein